MNRSPVTLAAAAALTAAVVAPAAHAATRVDGVRHGPSAPHPTAVSTASAATTPADPCGSALPQQTYAGQPPTIPARSYLICDPPSHGDAKRPLVVFLHGCNETAQQAATATHFDRLAAARGFVVVYPEQVVSAPSTAPLADGNGIGCWNWFLPQDQSRGAGEPAAIAGITRQVLTRYDIDPRRVYIEGISAGADMAVILGATYPDLYAAVGVLAGCSYRACGDGTGALTNQAMADRARIVPLFVENGSADTLNPLPLAVGLVQSWLGADDLADDGSANGSVSRTPASSQQLYFSQTPTPGSGDLCVHNDTFTCPGGMAGFRGDYPTTVLTWNAGAHDGDAVELWVLHGMEHAHPDASGDGPYTDPLGPDITLASYLFFTRHPMPATRAEVTR
jgi:poly(hydroxyalkanoate) depolymerase family esterase